MAIEAVTLAAMNQLAQQADSAAPVAGAAPQPTFGAVLTHAIQGVAAQQNQAYAQSQAYSQGSTEVPLSQVIIDLQKADISFRTLMQVRDKVIAAYQTISTMSV